MAVDQQEFRQVMGHFATGVTVITTHDGKGNLFGLTANAVSSVSLDPPLILCCIARSSESHAAFAASGVFSVHILSHAQEALSRRFAKSSEDKFVGVAFGTGASGCPILEGSLAHLECEIRHRFEAGDHTIFVGEPIGISMDQETDPLLYFRGGYRNLSA
jgi:flavin reductase (DIM6/NTAB) family NADH-FMN oxidoreductase RutF